MWKIMFVLVAAVFAVGYGGLIGGYYDVKDIDEGVQNALDFAVAQHNRNLNDVFLSKVTEVIRIQKQLVAGYNYAITVKMAKTSCRSDNPSEVCPVTDSQQARAYQCTFRVYNRPWTNEIRLEEEKC